MTKLRCVVPGCRKTFEATQDWQTEINAICDFHFRQGFAWSGKNNRVYGKKDTPAEVFFSSKKKKQEPEQKAKEPLYTLNPEYEASDPEPDLEPEEPETTFIPAADLPRKPLPPTQPLAKSNGASPLTLEDTKDIILSVNKGVDKLLENPCTSTGVLLLNFHNAFRQIKRLCGSKEA